MTETTAYFDAIYPIWDDYEKGKIGIKRRDDLLAPYRRKLHKLMNTPGLEEDES
jgi:hypothetical protein